MRIPGHPSLYIEWEYSEKNQGAMAMCIMFHLRLRRTRSMLGSAFTARGRDGVTLRSFGGHFREQKRLGWAGRPAEETLSV